MSKNNPAALRALAYAMESMTSSQRVEAIKEQITAAKREENQTYLDKIIAWENRPSVPGEVTSASFGSAGAAIEVSGWKHTFEDRIAELDKEVKNG